MYMLDTCTVSDLFAGRDGVEENLRAVTPAEVAISAVTVMEILYGFELNPSAKRRFGTPFDALCSTAQVVPFDSQVAAIAASLRAKFKTKGTPIGGWDLLIGATALAHGCILVTSNVKEFKRINGLSVENWRS